jgi:hypothetical protein
MLARALSSQTKVHTTFLSAPPVDKRMFLRSEYILKMSSFSLSGSNVVYFDIEQDGKPMGRVVIGLFGKVNAKHHCQGENNTNTLVLTM